MFDISVLNLRKQSKTNSMKTADIIKGKSKGEIVHLITFTETKTEQIEILDAYTKQEVLKWHKVIGDFLALINNQIEHNEVFGDFSQFNPQQ